MSEKVFRKQEIAAPLSPVRMRLEQDTTDVFETISDWVVCEILVHLYSNVDEFKESIKNIIHFASTCRRFLALVCGNSLQASELWGHVDAYSISRVIKDYQIRKGRDWMMPIAFRTAPLHLCGIMDEMEEAIDLCEVLTLAKTCARNLRSITFPVVYDNKGVLHSAFPNRQAGYSAKPLPQTLPHAFFLPMNVNFALLYLQQNLAGKAETAISPDFRPAPTVKDLFTTIFALPRIRDVCVEIVNAVPQLAGEGYEFAFGVPVPARVQSLQVRSVESGSMFYAARHILPTNGIVVGGDLLAPTSGSAEGLEALELENVTASGPFAPGAYKSVRALTLTHVPAAALLPSIPAAFPALRSFTLMENDENDKGFAKSKEIATMLKQYSLESINYGTQPGGATWEESGGDQILEVLLGDDEKRCAIKELNLSSCISLSNVHKLGLLPNLRSLTIRVAAENVETSEELAKAESQFTEECRAISVSNGSPIIPFTCWVSFGVSKLISNMRIMQGRLAVGFSCHSYIAPMRQIGSPPNHASPPFL